MERAGTITITPVVFLVLSAVLPRLSDAAEDRFVIVQPGYPGSTEEAKSFLGDLAQAIAKGGGPADLLGAYYNDAAEALKAVREERPSFGIASLGFYLEHKKDLQLEPLLESRPLGRFYLAVKKGQPFDLQDLAGQVVAGTPFNEKEFVARVLFGPGARGGPVNAGEDSKGSSEPASSTSPSSGAPPSGSPAPARPLADIGRWSIQPTASYSKAVRDVARGKARAVLLTELEKRALQDLAAGKELDVVFQTEPYPTALVVSFGPANAMARRSAKALEALKGTEDGNSLLKTMGIEGFAPADTKRLAVLEERYRAGGGDGSRTAQGG